MASSSKQPGSVHRSALVKLSTGIEGLDEITDGGLPAGRNTLICGGPGCGKTMLAMQFLIDGATNTNETGLFISFEEDQQHLLENFSRFSSNLEELVETSKIKLSYIDLSSTEIVQAGRFSLDGLLLRIEHHLKALKAKRVVIDALDSLFSALGDTNLRYELHRLLQWLSGKGVTSIITGERGSTTLTRYGFEDYTSDCVIFLDHRVAEQISKRRLRIVKYRGSNHGKDEYPYLIDDNGFSVLPITSLKLDFKASTELVSSGITGLDELLGGKGYYRGSSVLISGRAGTGKSSLSAAFVNAACQRGEKCLYFSFEESEIQLVRNMRSVGIDLGSYIEDGHLIFSAFRPNFRGIEEHLVAMTAMIDDFKPSCVVIDPITNFVSIGTPEDVKSMLIRVIDHLKNRGITMIFTALIPGSGRPDETDTAVSSMVDSWIALDLVLTGNCRHREIYVVKSRGMDHSHEIFQLLMSDKGFKLIKSEAQAQE